MVVPSFLVDDKARSSTGGKEDLQAVIIDFGQSVTIKHPSAQSLLERDVERVLSFFTRQGVETMKKDDVMTLVMEADNSSEEDISTDEEEQTDNFA